MDRTGAFVLSSGRCGSTLLSHMLAQHPELLSLSEFWSMQGGATLLARGELDGAAFWRTLSQPDPDLVELLARARIPEVLARTDGAARADLAPLLLVTLPELTHDPAALFAAVGSELRAQPGARPQEHVARLFGSLCERLHRPRWIERSGGSIEYADALARAWPDTRTIHLLRDGRECAVSMSRHPMFRVRVARLVHGTRLSIDACLRAEVPLDRFGAYWSALMARTARVLRDIPRERALVLTHAQLIAAPRSVLSRVARFLDLAPAADDWLERAAGLVRPGGSALDSLTREDRQRLERSCSPGMRTLDRLSCAA